jgi:hypothetical protein
VFGLVLLSLFVVAPSASFAGPPQGHCATIIIPTPNPDPVPETYNYRCDYTPPQSWGCVELEEDSGWYFCHADPTRGVIPWSEVTDEATHAFNISLPIFGFIFAILVVVGWYVMTTRSLARARK